MCDLGMQEQWHTEGQGGTAPVFKRPGERFSFPGLPQLASIHLAKARGRTFLTVAVTEAKYI